MTHYAGIAERLTKALALDIPPIALAFTNSPPENVSGANRVAAACTFWRTAEEGVFCAPPQAHAACEPGAMTMGFTITPEIQELIDELKQDPGKTRSLGCASGVEAAGEPLSEAAGRDDPGILYGPLADFPIEPDVVLVWLIARHAMTFNKAASLGGWANDPPFVTPATPACSGVPIARTKGAATVSLGCLGLRQRTRIADDRMLGALPGRRIEAAAADLERIAGPVNAMLSSGAGPNRA